MCERSAAGSVVYTGVDRWVERDDVASTCMQMHSVTCALHLHAASMRCYVESVIHRGRHDAPGQWQFTFCLRLISVQVQIAPQKHSQPRTGFLSVKSSRSRPVSLLYACARGRSRHIMPPLLCKRGSAMHDACYAISTVATNIGAFSSSPQLKPQTFYQAAAAVG